MEPDPDGVPCCSAPETQVWLVDDEDRAVAPASDRQAWAANASAVSISADMREGSRYLGRLFLTNEAGRSAYDDSAAVLVDNNVANDAGFIAGISIVVAALLVTLAGSVIYAGALVKRCVWALCW